MAPPPPPAEAVIPRKLWEHSDPQSTQMWRFKTAIEKKLGRTFEDFHALYTYSCTSRSAFWAHTFSYFPFVYTGTYQAVVDESARMDSIPTWFRGIKMNFAQNILFQGTRDGKPTVSPGKEDDKIACVEIRESHLTAPSSPNNPPILNVTWSELRRRVGILSNAFRAHGLKKGDRVAVVASNSLDTLTVLLATTALGGIFSSSSTDMGPKGILDRLLQIQPRFVFMDDLAVYNGATIDLRPKMAEIAKTMAGIDGFQTVISQARFRAAPADVAGIERCVGWEEFLAKAGGREELRFDETVEFGDPFLIVYSSGTTGQPKCIVHCVGGVVLTAHKEGRLHREIDEKTVLLQYTTTGWIMYLAAVQCLLMGAKMIMYDGSPFVPNLESFMKLVGEQKVTHFGTSPKYLHALQKASLTPRTLTDLSNLKVVTSTGMVLPPAIFTWFYDTAFPPTVHLDNISGGTDIAGAFACGNPILPVHADGGCQGPSLGTPVAVFDQVLEGGRGIKGKEVEHGVPGELVATAAFPNMPVGFWGPGGREKYWQSYFGRFDDVWVHGDFVCVHPGTKGITFLGRADGVLNPSGVRFGSAEIYGIVDAKFGDKIADSICVGRRRPDDHDEAVMLFLLMKPGVEFSESLVNDVKAAIRKETSPRHVPSFVFETPEIPTTVNLKKVELPVKQIVSGKVIKPSGTLANPKSLDFYYQFAKVELPEKGPKAKL